MTVFIFNYDANRVLTTIAKVRINLQVSLDGHTSKGTAEVVVMDRAPVTLAGGCSVDIPAKLPTWSCASRSFCRKKTIVESS
jgi:hypothetical protein